MTQIPAHPPAPTTRPIICWTLIQLAGLLISISGLAFWKQTGDIDRHALDVLLTIDLAASALLIAWLVRDGSSAIAMILIPLPFLQLVAAVAAIPSAIALRAIVGMTIWSIALACLIATARKPLIRATVTAIASGITIGGVALFYLREEFAVNAAGSRNVFFGPIPAMLTLANPSAKLSDVHAAWGIVAIAALVCIIAASANYFASMRRR